MDPLFEDTLCLSFDVDVHYVGHPLIDAINNFQSKAQPPSQFYENNNLSDKPILAILPGSRNQEIKVKLPLMLKASKAFSEYQVVIAGAPNKSEAFYQPLIEGYDVKVLENQTYDLLNQADLAMVTSGTATLETALFNVPQVVCYKASTISYHIAKRLVKIKFISLVNLIMDKAVVTELIQGELTEQNIVKELQKIKVAGSEGRQKMLKDYADLKLKLGGGGASKKVASLMLNAIRKHA